MQGAFMLLLVLGVGCYMALSFVAGKHNAARAMLFLFTGGLKGLAKSVVLGINLVRQGAFRMPVLAGRRSVVLGPGDAPAHTDRIQDVQDYRGLATERELAALKRSGIPLGHYRDPRGRAGALLRLPADLLTRHCVLVGPPGAGKTESLLLPWLEELLRQGYSVVTVDVKGDLTERLERVTRRTSARFWYWNSGDRTRSQAWNWLDAIQEPRDVEAAVQSILGRPKANDAQPFFYERDYRWLRALVQICKQAWAHTAKPQYLYTLVSDQSFLRDLFQKCPPIRGLANDVADLLQFAPDEHSRAVSGLLNALHLFNTQAVARVTDHSDFDLANIADAPTLLLVGAPLADARAAEVLSSIMLNQLFSRVYRRFQAGGSGPRPLFFLIDEAPRLKDRIHYEEVLSIARSARVGICLVAQDVSQFGDGRQVSSILTNCLTMLVLRGASPETARYFSARLGQHQVPSSSSNRGRGPLDLLHSQGRNLQLATVPVLAEREIMHPPVGAYCAVAQVTPVCARPFLIELLPPGAI